MSADWMGPRWVRYNKHVAPPNVDWGDLVKSSKDVSYYHPSIDDEEQERLELRCLSEGVLFRATATKRMYWMRLEDNVGAAEGEETNLIYVEWSSGGEVHGRPVTAAQLKRKGAKL